jgi:Zn-dependent peptidase ImmA (M78 family)
MKFGRIDLADCGSPHAILKVISELHEGNFVLPIPIEEWARELDIVDIQALEVDGFEGGLMMFSDRSSGTILYSQSANSRRKRFTIAHELGHFLMPSHVPRDGKAFMCKKSDMALFRVQPGGDRYIQMEVQANQLAAGLLMPQAAFELQLRRHTNFEIQHIPEIAETFDVSKEACCRRCVEISDDLIAIIIAKDCVVKNIYKNPAFPMISSKRGDRLSYLSNLKLNPGMVSDWKEDRADVWCTDTRGTICLQSLGQREGFSMTLLTYEAPEDQDEDEEVERRWSAPTFRR